MNPEVTGLFDFLNRLADASAMTLALFALFALWKGWIIFPGTYTTLIEMHERRYADLQQSMQKLEAERQEWKAIAFRSSELNKIVVPVAIEKAAVHPENAA